MSHKFSKALYCGTAMALLFPMVLKAQEAPTGKGTHLEEIVVTATRTKTNLQTTPVAVTAISGQALQNRGVQTILDIAGSVPSLSIGSRSGTGAASGGISIRGMGVDATDSSAAVGVYVDDVYFASGQGNLLGLMDVDRVEVLRGPQGTLFGRNTIAGAIQYVTRQPTQKLSAEAGVIYGNDGRLQEDAVVNIPINSTLALRVAGMSNLQGGYIHDNYANTERGGDRTQAGRVKLRWTPNDRLTVDIKGDILSDRTNGRAVLVAGVNPNAEFPGLAQLFGETRPLNNSYISPNNTSFSGFAAPDFAKFYYNEAQGVLNYKLTDDLNIKSITSYASYRSRVATDFSNTPLSILEEWPARNDTTAITQEVQLTGKSFSDRLKWTVGAYYYDSSERQNPGEGIQLGFGPIMYPYGNPATDIQSEAGYGQATYTLTDQWSATVGLRYSSETNTSWTMGQTLPKSATFTDTSPYFGVNFQLDDDAMIYAKVSKGFRAGGFTINTAFPGGALAFNPETAWTYELGARTEFLDHRLRINPTFYFTDWSNIQFNSLVPTSSTIIAATQNAGDAQIKGFELESQYAVTSELQMNGSLSLLQGNYTRVANLTRAEYPFGYLATFSGAPGTTVTVPNITLGTPLQRAPKFKFDVGAQYCYPLAWGADLAANADYSWTSKQYSAVTIGDSVVMPAYGLLDARLQYNSAAGWWSAAVFGTNLTNSAYLIGGVNFAAGYTVGTKELDPGRPQEYGLELRVRY